MTKDSSEYEKPEIIKDRKTEKKETEGDKENVSKTNEDIVDDDSSMKLKNFRVGSVHDAADYLKDNEYIKHGYRINFNSTRKVFRSLFMLHNESVNIWSHLIGAVIIILVIVYTSFYIRANKNHIMEGNLHLNFTEINEEIRHVTKPIFDYIPTIHNITEGINKNYEKSVDAVHNITASILNKASEYIHKLDEKIGIYTSYVNCLNCYEEIFESVKILKDKIGESLASYGGKIINESKHIIKSIEDTAVIHFIEDLNFRILKFQNKYAEMLNDNDPEWIERYENQHDQFSQLERWPMFIMLVSAIICLSCSTIFHLLSAHSKELHNLLNRLDYAGISILIAGSCYPPFYYFFYCKQILAISYLAFISIFAISVFVYSIKPDFNAPNKRKLRGTLFLVLGLSTAIPLLHLAFFPSTIENFKAPFPLLNWYLGGVSYVSGALIYILRFPERFRPGKHDIWGSSHQIFHCCVLMGVAFHYLGSLNAYYYRAQYRCEIS